MKNYAKSLFSVFLFVCASFVFSACNGVDLRIIDVSFDQSVLDSTYEISEFNIEDYFLTITFSDGSIQLVEINENMISSSDLLKLSNVGTHTIEVLYQGFKVSIIINLSDSANNELNLLLSNLFSIGVSEGAIIDLTYEEWLESIRGERGYPGTDGREVLFQIADGYIQWQYTGDTTWTNLLELTALVGPAGTDGTDGKQVTFQVSEGFIQWQYVGDSTWNNLIDLATITGADGSNGTDGVDGREVLFQVADGYIQWQYTGDTTWTNLIELSTLVGPAGDDGVNGTDGKQVTFQVSEGFIQWQYVGDSIWNNLIDLATITGTDGQDGTNGVDGREVLFQVAEGYIQWQYTGDTTWTNLIELSTLVGPAGDDGVNGTDGKQVTFQVSEGFIQWQYVGDSTWNNLIDLQIIKGADGRSAYEIYIEKYPNYDKSESEWIDDLVNGLLKEQSPFTIKFVTNSNIVVEDIQVNAFESVELPILDRGSYFTFKGWFTGNTINDGQFYNFTLVNSDITLYARWESTIVYNIIDINGYEVIEICDYTGSESSITIPYSIDGYQVYSIKGYAFSGNETINTIRFVSDVKIGDYAFSNMPNLSYVDLSEIRSSSVGLNVFESSVNISEIKLNLAHIDLQSIFSGKENIPNSTTKFCLVANTSYGYVNNMDKLNIGLDLLIDLDDDVIGVDFSASSENAKIYYDISDQHPIFASSEGVLYSKDLTILYKFPVFWDENSYTVKANVSQIDHGAFTFSKLETLTISQSVVKIMSAAFSKSEISQINFEENSQLKYVGSAAFSEMLNLRQILLPSSIERMEFNPFRYNVMSNIYVNDDSGNYISQDGVLYELQPSGQYKLISYPALNGRTEFYVPDNVESIGSTSFNGYYVTNDISLAVILSDSVKYIENSAFEFCDYVKYLHIGEGLEKIDFDAIDLTNLLYLDISPNNDNFIYDGIGLYNVLEDKTLRLMFYNANIPLDHYSIMENTTVIDYGVFETLQVKSLEIPETVLFINLVFAPFLEEIIVDLDNPYYESIDGVLYTKSGKTLVKYPSNREGASYTIKDGTEHIDFYAFTMIEGPFELYLNEEVNCEIWSFLYSNILFRGAINSSMQAFLDENNLNYIVDTETTYDLHPNRESYLGMYDYYIDNETIIINDFFRVPDIRLSFDDIYDMSSIIVDIDRPFSVQYTYSPFRGLEDLWMNQNMYEVWIHASTYGIDYTPPVVNLHFESKNSRIVLSTELSDIYDLSDLFVIYAPSGGSIEDFANANNLPFVSTSMQSADWEYSLFRDRLTITNYLGENHDIVIPNMINDYVVSYIDDNIFQNLFINQLVVQEGIIGISSYAFDSTSSIGSIQLPSSLINYNIQSLSFVKGLECIHINENNNDYYDIDGVVFSKIEPKLVLYPPYRTGDYIVPDGIEIIGEFSFDQAINLTSIYLSSDTKVIEPYAFRYAINLTSIDLNQVEFIGNGAFSYTKSLFYVRIPVTVTYIGNSVLYNSAVDQIRFDNVMDDSSLYAVYFTFLEELLVFGTNDILIAQIFNDSGISYNDEPSIVLDILNNQESVYIYQDESFVSRDPGYDSFITDESLNTMMVYTSEDLLNAIRLGYTPTFESVTSTAYLVYVEAKSILNQIIGEGYTDHEKVVAIYEYLVIHVSYDVALLYEDLILNNFNLYRSNYIEGALIDHLAACQGYTKTFELLATMEGIKTISVYGFANEIGHAWNKVYIDDVWYVVDVTWGDLIMGKTEFLSHQYLFVTDADIVDTHIAHNDNPVATGTVDYYDYILLKGNDIIIDSVVELELFITNAETNKYYEVKINLDYGDSIDDEINQIAVTLGLNLSYLMINEILYIRVD